MEYAVRDDDEKRSGYSPDRKCDRSPDRKRRSPSPFRRERGSPDYGINGISRSPYKKQRASPDYGSRRSPSPYQRDMERGSPDYGRRRSPNPSPYSRREPERSTDHVRAPRHSSPHQREGANEDPVPNRICSPYERERESPTGERRSSYSPRDRERSNPDNGHDQRLNTAGEPGDSPSFGGTESPKHRGYSRFVFFFSLILFLNFSSYAFMFYVVAAVPLELRNDEGLTK